MAPKLIFCHQEITLKFLSKFREIVCTQIRGVIGFKFSTFDPRIVGGTICCAVNCPAGAGLRKEALVLGLGRTLHRKGHTDKALPHLFGLGY